MKNLINDFSDIILKDFDNVVISHYFLESNTYELLLYKNDKISKICVALIICNDIVNGEHLIYRVAGGHDHYHFIGPIDHIKFNAKKLRKYVKKLAKKNRVEIYTNSITLNGLTGIQAKKIMDFVETIK